jgi:beta-glucanase (GH16 family)
LYTDENHKLVNGNLEITALKQGDKYTSSRLTTKDKKNFSTVILKLEQSCLWQGVWPAFWMLGSNINEVGWPKTGVTYWNT